MIYTIGREFDSGGHQIGAELARLLDIPFYDKEFIETAETVSGIRAEVLNRSDEKKENSWLYTVHYNTSEDFRGMSAGEILFRIQSRLVLEYASGSDCVIVGRCADHVLDNAGVKHLSIFISAPTEERIKRISNIRALTEKEAAALISREPLIKSFHDTLSGGFSSVGNDGFAFNQCFPRTDKQHKSYYEYYTGRSWGKPSNYDMCINSASFGIQRAVEAAASCRVNKL